MSADVVLWLQGRALRAADGTVIATLGPDDVWRTADGTPTGALESHRTPLRARIRDTDRRDADACWRRDALPQLRELCERLPLLTSDDVWAHLVTPPREARMIGALLNDARREGLIVATADYRRSRRREIGGRRVRVWRSLLIGQQRLDTSPPAPTTTERTP